MCKHGRWGWSCQVLFAKLHYTWRVECQNMAFGDTVNSLMYTAVHMQCFNCHLETVASLPIKTRLSFQCFDNLLAAHHVVKMAHFKCQWPCWCIPAEEKQSNCKGCVQILPLANRSNCYFTTLHIFWLRHFKMQGRKKKAPKKHFLWDKYPVKNPFQIGLALALRYNGRWTTTTQEQPDPAHDYHGKGLQRLSDVIVWLNPILCTLTYGLWNSSFSLP